MKRSKNYVLEYSLGIKIEQVVLQDVNPPDPVKDAFNAVNQAQQEKETSDQSGQIRI